MSERVPMPSDWAEKPVGELFLLDSGAAPVDFRPGDLSGPVLVYGANGPIGSSTVDNYGPGYLVGRVGSAGSITLIPKRVWASDNALTATPRADRCDVHFAGHLLRFLNPAKLATMTAQPLVTQGNLARMSARVPLEISEQSRIAAVLDTLDEAIAKTETVIAKLKQVRAGLLRDPVAHPEQFQDSPLGRIPRACELKTLSSLCVHIGSGVTPRGGQEVYTSSGILFIRSQNVMFEGLLLDDVAYISEHIHLGMLRSETFAHDVLFNITGASIGRGCPMPEGLGKANVNQHVCVLRVADADAGDAKYLASVLSSSIGQRQLDALNTMGNRQGLNYQQLGSFLIPWPKSQERRLIASKISTVEDQVRAEDAECTKLKLLKSGLMSDLLTGRVRVPESPLIGARRL